MSYFTHDLTGWIALHGVGKLSVLTYKVLFMPPHFEALLPFKNYPRRPSGALTGPREPSGSHRWRTEPFEARLNRVDQQSLRGQSVYPATAVNEKSNGDQSQGGRK
ncbi:hypothetical protein OCOJLMKI_0804 [Methylobacterium iners]|uniref:Uncharacterized protein n=1 Tax=Methylobacterium iners TaxID=418707 RepID=A0ABQ4RS48_9HYPH|nr:hypothetical protein OCOJLMKI_0804 [Methylobacterium iners]